MTLECSKLVDFARGGGGGVMSFGGFCRPRSSCIPKPVFDCKVVGNSPKTLTNMLIMKLRANQKQTFTWGVGVFY